MKVLITGGMGFIGSHLASKYLDNCSELFLIDNLSTNTLSPDSDFILKNKKIKFLQMDLCALSEADLLHLEEILKKVSLVFHFAGPVGVRHIDENPKGAVRSLYFATATLFPLFEKYNNYSEIIVVHGYNRFIESRRQINCGKNLTKINATTHYEQAILEATSKWTKQKNIEKYYGLNDDSCKL